MSETTLTLSVPDSLAQEFETLKQEFLLKLLKRGLREVKIDRALDLYARGGMSFGAAAERAGIPQSELARHAYARGMEPSFSSETLSEDLL